MNRDGVRRVIGWIGPPLTFFLVRWSPHPPTIAPEGWKIIAVSASTMAGIVLRPAPQSIVTIGGLLALVGFAGVPWSRAMAGFANPAVWLVLAAIMMARAITNSGLARRMALIFVQTVGHTSLRLASALVATDAVLATVVPSISARSGAILLPIGERLAGFYGSDPGPTASRMGTFLMVTMYQCSTILCAAFLTGQAGNLVAVALASQALGVTLTWADWFLAALVPSLVSAFLSIRLIHGLAPPLVRETPTAPSFAAKELALMGPMTRREWVVLTIAGIACALWASSSLHGWRMEHVAAGAVLALLPTGTMRLKSLLKDYKTMDVIVWYGGLLSLAAALAASGAPASIARSLQGLLGTVDSTAAFVLISLFAYFSHYAFASITAQVLVLFLPLTLTLQSVGVPLKMASLVMLFMFNLSAGLTHYGTTNGPIIFARGYVTMGTWWRIGLLLSLSTLSIWLIIGRLWWWLIGLW